MSLLSWLTDWLDTSYRPERKKIVLVVAALSLAGGLSLFLYLRVRHASPKAEIPPLIEIPKFPWPPAASSAKEVLPPALFKSARWFADVDRLLSAALEENGYVERSYYAVPRGFALVTRIEQIELDGRSKRLPDRWSAAAPRLTSFSISEYVRALFTAAPGHYRIIVFILTEAPFSQSQMEVSKPEAMDWLRGGLNVLPPEVSARPLAANVNCTALVYEFEQLGSSAHVLLPSEIDARTHLVKAGLWGALESKQRKEINTEVLLSWQCRSDIDLHVELADGDTLSYQTPCGRSRFLSRESAYADYRARPSPRVGCLQEDIRDGPGTELVLLSAEEIATAMMVHYYHGRVSCPFSLEVRQKGATKRWSGTLSRRGEYQLFSFSGRSVGAGDRRRLEDDVR
jgi:hypothetical protein